MSLRSRLLLALLATSAVTLGVAALALLSPLQTKLDAQGRDSVKAAALATRPALAGELVKARGALSLGTVGVLETFKQRTGANVALYDSAPAADDNVPNEVYNLGLTERDPKTLFRVITSNRVQSSTTRDGSGVAIPVPLSQTALQRKVKLPLGHDYFILVVRKPDVGGEAVDTVRSAFLTAAVIGLGVALLLGLLLSAGLARRLGRLRRSALALAADGVGAPPPPVDDGQDEVGDLARALASMQRALRRQEEARRAFVATASHELRTPLTSLQGNLELLTEDLERGELDVEDARAQLRGAQFELRRLSNLASELLDLSRLDAGVELRREPVELGELTRAVAAEFALRARDRAVELVVVPPTGPVWAGGDPGAVARAGRILIDNALRFSAAGDEVRVAAAYHGERATLEVTDNGPGVPAGERDLIFERFQRGTHTGGEGGFGLGLAIGRELARRMDGELQLASEGEGEGARFVLALPIELPRGSGDGDTAGDVEAGQDAGPVRDPASAG